MGNPCPIFFCRRGLQWRGLHLLSSFIDWCCYYTRVSYTGSWEPLVLSQLRNSGSFLNFDLFLVGIVSDPSCWCGAAIENLKHFFLDCPIYLQAKTTLIGNINRVTTCYSLDIEFMTCGNANLTYEQHCIINI
jgi:hypothetical protein